MPAPSHQAALLQGPQPPPGESDMLRRPMNRPPMITLACGTGRLRVERVEQRSVVTRALVASPLRLLMPRSGPGDAAWVITSTFGGGLVAGDEINLSVDVAAGASCFLGAQSATKIYRSTGQAVTRQALRLTLGDQAACVVFPHPLTPYAQARFEQRTQLTIAPSATLVWLDWLTSGRRARGERWAFDRYRSDVSLHIDRRLALRDSLLLDQADGPIDDEQRMGRFDCFGSMVLAGERIAAACDELIGQAGRDEADGILDAASPIPGGAIVKFAAKNTQQCVQWIRRKTAFVGNLLGVEPWSRVF